MEARNNILGMQNETLINDMGTKNGAPLVESSKNVKNAETNILFSHGAIISNKKLIASLGNDATLLLGEIYSEHLYFKGKGETEGGWFFSTVRNLQNCANLSKYKQKKALDKLEKYGILQIKRAGVFGRRHIKFNEDMLRKIICDDKYLTSQKNLPVEVKLFDHSINKNKTNKNNKNISKKETHAREENFGVENLEKEIEKIKELEEINEELRESNKKLKETNKELRKELRELRKYDKSMEKFLNKLDKLEQEEEIKKNPVDSYNVGDKTHSSYSENYVSKTPKIPGGGRSGDPDHNFGGDKKPFKLCRPSFNQLIEEYTDNTELQYELKQHLKVRKIKGALCNYSIKLGFKTLDEYAKTDREKILMVRNANEGGWTKFYELPKWQKPREHADREVSYDIAKYANTYI